MSEISFQQWCGYAFCLAGIVLGCAALLAYVSWGWGLLALLLFVVGCVLLRSNRRDDWIDDVGDLVDSGIDLMD